MPLSFVLHPKMEKQEDDDRVNSLRTGRLKKVDFQPMGSACEGHPLTRFYSIPGTKHRVTE